jgi:hypothetical protein
MMTKSELFSLWAPDASIWSRWAKPVLFSSIPPLLTPAPNDPADTGWCPPSDDKTALVLDLPGAEGVFLGVALAALGYRPVPLYNALPLPPGESSAFSLGVRKPIAAVDVLPILDALIAGSDQLVRLTLPPNAPPVFLLDANRGGIGRTMKENEFDNRSISFTTDFPSANFLASRGIERVILVQKHVIEPQNDLAHSFCRWQEGGLKLGRVTLAPRSGPEPFEVRRPSWYGLMFQRALDSLGLRRSGVGGFGAWVPDSSSGG